MSGPSSCTRCAGALPSPDADGNIVCPACGLFHHVGDDPAPPPPPPPPPPASTAGPFGAGAATGGSIGAPPPRPSGRSRIRVTRGPGSGLGCILAVVILVAVLAPVAFVVVGVIRALSGTDSDGSALELTVTTGDSEVVTDADGRATEIVGLALPVGTGTRVVARAAIDGEVAWTAAVVPTDVYSAQFRVTDDLVLASLGDQVLALDGTTGTIRWRATVADDVDPRCRDCMAVFGSTLVVFSRDATVTALALGDGSSPWSRRLDSPQGSVHVAGGALLVLDQPVGGQEPAALAATDPATGEERSRIAPRCAGADDPTGSDRDIPFETGSEVIPVPDSDDVVLVFGFVPVCVQRWTMGQPEPRWSRTTDLEAILGDVTVTTDGTDLVLDDSSTLVRVGLSEGTVEALTLPADTVPAGTSVLAGGRLVTAVASNRGTARLTLVAIDLRTREVLWERPLPRGVEAFDLDPSRSSDTLFEGDARFLLAPSGPDQVALVTLASPGRRLTVEGIDVATGRGHQVGRAVFAVRYSGSSSPSARIEAVTGGQVVFTTESIPQVLDLATGTITASWADG